MITAQASNSAYEVSEQGITAMIFFFRQEGIDYSIPTLPPPLISNGLKKKTLYLLLTQYLL